MKYLIIGYSKSGKAVFEKLKGNDVTVYDDNIKDKNVINYTYLQKEKPLFDLGIISPGFDVTSYKYRLIKSLCRDIISEIDFAFLRKKISIIGITGSNGKTTLATYLDFFLSLKYKTFLCGNIGLPMTEIIDEVEDNDIVILELSSFQIRDSKHLKLEELFLTSLSPNHLDHYDSKDHYYADKKRGLLFLQDKSFITEFKGPFTYKNSKNYLKNIKGKYALKYALIAMNYAYKLGIPEDEIIDKCKLIRPILYRLNPIIKYGNKTFVNDSKSTTVAATLYCYSQFKNEKCPIILIIGGVSKSDSFKKLKMRNNDLIFIYGRDKNKINSECNGKKFNNLEQVINQIFNYNGPACILFSPGCSSLDQYRSYIERGEHFNLLIKKYFGDINE